jgi:hypothetical protein
MKNESNAIDLARIQKGLQGLKSTLQVTNWQRIPDTRDAIERNVIANIDILLKYIETGEGYPATPGIYEPYKPLNQ